MSSNQSGEGEIRRAIIEADLVDCMVALPGQLFYSTQIPVCLWFLSRDKRRQSASVPRSPPPDTLHRRPQTRPLIDRVHRELTDADIAAHRADLSRLARQRRSTPQPAFRSSRIRRHSRLLQIRHYRRNRAARLRAHSRPLRRRRGSRRRRRTVRGKDDAPRHRTERPVRRVRETGASHQSKPNGAGLWQLNWQTAKLGDDDLHRDSAFGATASVDSEFADQIASDVPMLTSDMNHCRRRV